MTRRALPGLWIVVLVAGVAAATLPLSGQRGPAVDPSLVAALEWRSIGPAVTGGRVVDIAVADAAAKTIYIASASGGVWKTVNAGTTWTPVFEREGSISVGDIAVASSNPNVVWVGTGEANNQRSSSWGDGVYKSLDGGKTWMHMGLRASQHIGRIVIHPTNPDVVYVAAVGPLWGPGGERGLFLTFDGGKTWANKKSIGEHTGFTDVAMDPKDPDVLYAAAYQRERREYSFLGGGPESGIWKSTDGGESWTELTVGLPQGDMGRIGLDVCRSRPSRLYATVQALDGGVFRSDDYGASWTKTNDVNQTPWYYSQIRCDPNLSDRVYSVGTQLVVSDDGGVTFRRDGASSPHVDHHALWIDPADSDHLLLGNDGGFYLSHDQGKTWDMFNHLPITQFYAVAVDLREPFYYIYGGTQDNRSWGGPSATRSRFGIINTDWYQTQGGDGFYAAIDPTDPNIVYAESQNGGLVRYDVRTGERKSIKPQDAPGEKPLRWNWSAPILISPHDHSVIYFGANHLFRSSDRGDRWVKLGGDLTRQLDRDELPMMGKPWGRDAISRHEGTAAYGNISTIDESPIEQGLLYVATDDGLVQVSRDGGQTWKKIERFPGVPERAWVSRVIASHHAEGTVYVTFDAHKSNDFEPYVLKSTDYGDTWTSIASNLPEGSLHVIREHPRNPALLFVGSEFGVFFTIDGGGSWIPLKNNLPTISVHDMVIHPRENDLVLGTHGRGFWILDDIRPLEELTPVLLAAPATLFPARPAMQFNPSDPGFGDQGERFFQAPNPPFGVTLTAFFPKALARGQQPRIDIVAGDGRVVRTLDVPGTAGMHRVTWDLRWEPPYTVETPQGGGGGFFGGAPRGPFVMPGEYTARLTVTGEGAPAPQQAPVVVEPDLLVPMSDADRQALHQIRMQAWELQRRVQAAVQTAEQTRAQMDAAKKAMTGVTVPEAVTKESGALDKEIDDLIAAIRGARGRGFGGGGEVVPVPSIQQRLNGAAGAINNVTSLPTADQREAIASADAEFRRELPRLNAVISTRMPAFLASLDEAGVPWSIGRAIR